MSFMARYAALVAVLLAACTPAPAARAKLAAAAPYTGDMAGEGQGLERAVRMAPCPVLTVHQAEHEFIAPDALVAVRKRRLEYRAGTDTRKICGQPSHHRQLRRSSHDARREGGACSEPSQSFSQS